MSYGEDEYLLLSGIQHFVFCRRQWALIHIEQQWQDNRLTAEGNIVHERCHDEELTEKRRNILVSRGMRVVSPRLGVTGQCDVVEFTKAGQGCVLHGREGLWQVRPVEYKHGQAKSDDSDILQLCCQAMCLEEMLSCDVNEGDLFYNETHRRQSVQFTAELRQHAGDIIAEMHNYYKRAYTPKVKTGRKCQSCSLKELCMPQLCKKLSVRDYYRDMLEAD